MTSGVYVMTAIAKGTISADSYDNTMANPYVRRMLVEQSKTAPFEVVYGQETVNEMCGVALGIIQ